MKCTMLPDRHSACLTHTCAWYSASPENPIQGGESLQMADTGSSRGAREIPAGFVIKVPVVHREKAWRLRGSR